MSFIFNLNGVSVLVMVGFKLHTYRDARNLPHDSLEYSELKNGGLLNKDQLPAALGFLTVADAAKIQQQQPEVRNIFNIYNPHTVFGQSHDPDYRLHNIPICLPRDSLDRRTSTICNITCMHHTLIKATNVYSYNGFQDIEPQDVDFSEQKKQALTTLSGLIMPYHYPDFVLINEGLGQ